MDVSNAVAALQNEEIDCINLLSGIYYQGFDDCLDIMLYALNGSKNLDDFKLRIECIQVLVKSKKFERLRRDLGVIGEMPF